MKREDRKNIVVARDARALGHERRRGAFQQWQGSIDGLANLRAVLGGQDPGGHQGNGEIPHGSFGSDDSIEPLALDDRKLLIGW